MATSNDTSTDVPSGSRGDDAPKPPLAIVFTDIVKSTAMWEKDSSAMSEAMFIHDSLIRDLSNIHGGYEVKQNGDGFMIAFQSAVSALNFCLDVQIKLQEQDWPEALLELEPGKPVVEDESENDGQGEAQRTVLWKGLRLRMSTHFGEPVCKWNEVIQRMDFLGPAVNRAARFISACEGGQIVVSEEFLAELKTARRDTVGEDGLISVNAQAESAGCLELGLEELQSEKMLGDVVDTRFEVRLLGERHFKGVSEDQKLFFIVPKLLHGRLNYFPRHMYVQPSKGNLTG
ncbi:hypothetical protein PMZ80_006019 [Knufia obscura]|uniref:Guanylate cyclase domain-containing protein n=2 Tax=Knufia TaxID=430999 RepID=A0AAN8EN18_9EURO|nr:hypothetical protein PMZ80_006019 [Knufia obscura]KAK5954687.1 hypothetical protein OHC33_004411 [Knufia fluminis]